MRWVRQGGTGGVAAIGETVSSALLNEWLSHIFANDGNVMMGRSDSTTTWTVSSITFNDEDKFIDAVKSLMHSKQAQWVVLHNKDGQLVFKIGWVW